MTTDPSTSEFDRDIHDEAGFATPSPIEHELARTQELERDLVSEIVTSRRNAWRVAAVMASITTIMTIALALVFPLKEPADLWVVRVNDATGDVEHVSRLGDGQQDYGERMARYWLQQYVLACESYDWNTIQNTYDRCALFSSPDVQQAYYAKFKGEQALDKRFGKHTRILVNVRSITLGPNQTAVVRFTRRTEGANRTPSAEQLIATISYQYVNAPMNTSTALANPLGFLVNTYTADIETLR